MATRLEYLTDLGLTLLNKQRTYGYTPKTARKPAPTSTMEDIEALRVTGSAYRQAREARQAASAPA